MRSKADNIQLVRQLFVFLAIFFFGLHALVPHLHEAKRGDVLLLHSETHRSQNLLCTLLRTVETDLGLGHLEQITQAQEADLSLEAIVSKPAADDRHGNLAFTGYLLTKLLPETAILPQVVASNSLLPDQFGSWVGSRRGPPLA